MTSTDDRRSTADRRRERGRDLTAEISGALAKGEIEILLQPQFACADGALVGAEALARWRHPGRGLIGAEALFALAGGVGMAEALTAHIASRAFAEAAEWPGDLRLSVNVTPADLGAADFADKVTHLVAQSRFAPERLTLEITEQALVRDVERCAEQLSLLARRGIRIALDDFGAGFCNFRYLKILPLDYLKLDRTMVDGIASDDRDLAVLRAIVAMAGALGLAVIAEGIETEEQLARVRAEGCELFQGFLRARPMSPDAFLAFARSR